MLNVKGSGNISYPGLIAAWSAEGKSNQDEDRNVLKDLTGNGFDIILYNFLFNESNGYIDNYLVFDGSGCYGLCNNISLLTDYTIIAKRDWSRTNIGKNKVLICKANGVELGNNYKDEKGIFCLEFISYVSSRYETRSFGVMNVISNVFDRIGTISFQTKYSYNGIFTLSVDESQEDYNELYIGKKPIETQVFKGHFYSAYLFDRSLDEQEIKSFIRKYIDSTYLLPSETL